MLREDELVEWLKAGNLEALEYMMSKYSNLIFKVSYGVLNNREISKECVNDVFLKVWDNIDNFSGDINKFRNWLCTISKYTAVDMLRKEAKYLNDFRLEEYTLVGRDIEKEIETKEELQEVMNAIDKLSNREQEIFRKRYILGQSSREVAISLGLTEKHIGQIISRARKKIKNIVNVGVLLIIVNLTIKL